MVRAVEPMTKHDDLLSSMQIVRLKDENIYTLRTVQFSELTVSGSCTVRYQHCLAQFSGQLFDLHDVSSVGCTSVLSLQS